MKKLVFIYIILTGILFSFLVPPFQKPDETVHFQKTILVSRGLFDCSKSKFAVNKGYLDLIDDSNLHRLIANREEKVNFIAYSKKLQAKNTYKTAAMDTAYICTFPTISYIPQAIGLLFGQSLGFNSYISFFLGRFIAFLFFFVWFYKLYKYIPKNLKNILLFVFALPMTIHQLTAYNYDGIQIMFALTIFVVFVKTLSGRFISVANVFLGLGSIFGFIISRPIVKFAYNAYSQPPAQIYFLSNPLFLIEMLLKTTFARLVFYVQSMVGIFGWLEYGLDWPAYFIIILIMIYLIFSTRLNRYLVIPKLISILMTIGFIFIYVGLLVFNYLYWTAFGSKISEGTQGRYFLPFLPFGIYWLINIKEKYFPYKISMGGLNKIFILGGIIVFLSIIKSILFRFYI